MEVGQRVCHSQHGVEWLMLTAGQANRRGTVVKVAPNGGVIVRWDGQRWEEGYHPDLVEPDRGQHLIAPISNRDKAVLAAVDAGERRTEIGKRFKISYQRVQQIVKLHRSDP